MTPPDLRVGRVRLARVARHEAWFAARLPPEERALVAAARVTKRRVDLLAGRVAAHRALGALACCVLPAAGDDEGRPRVCSATGAPIPDGPDVSISHGGGWAVAAAVRDGRVGIDVERVEPRDPSFLREAFAKGELTRFGAALGLEPHDPRLVTLAWCTKEALLKVAGTGLRAALPAMVPGALRLAAPGVPGEALRFGSLATDELGEVTVALELARAHALALAWRPPT